MRRVLSFYLLLLGIVWLSPAQAYLNLFPQFPNTDFGSWDGQGNLQRSASTCVLSFKSWGNFSDYRVMATSNEKGLKLVNQSDSNISLVVGMVFTGSSNGGGAPVSTPLVDGRYSSVNMPGSNCLFSTNARLQMSFLRDDMYKVAAGHYAADFTFGVCRVQGGNNCKQEVQKNMRLAVELPPLIQLTGLSDIDFGSYDGMSPEISQGYSFCVYSNTGLYSLTASALEAANGEDFALVGKGKGELLTYEVRVDDSVDASAEKKLKNGVAKRGLKTRQNSSMYSRECLDKGDNASLEVRIKGEELNKVSGDSYESQLTIMVEPE